MLMAWDLEVLSGSHHVHHTTVINWVRQVGEQLPDAYELETNPEVGERGCTRDFCWL